MILLISFGFKEGCYSRACVEPLLRGEAWALSGLCALCLILVPLLYTMNRSEPGKNLDLFEYADFNNLRLPSLPKLLVFYSFCAQLLCVSLRQQSATQACVTAQASNQQPTVNVSSPKPSFSAMPCQEFHITSSVPSPQSLSLHLSPLIFLRT